MAKHCDLQVPCHTCQVPVSYTKDTVDHVVMTGLNDRNLQQLCTTHTLLNNAKNTNHLVEFCNAHENGKLSQATIAGAPESTHQKNKRNLGPSPPARE